MWPAKSIPSRSNDTVSCSCLDELLAFALTSFVLDDSIDIIVGNSCVISSIA